MSENELDCDPKWASSLTIAAVKVFQLTLGKFPTPNVNLRLVNNLPFFDLNPLLERLDVLNLIIVPLVCTFMVTLYLLLTSPNTLTSKQIIQIMCLLIMISWLVFGCSVRRVIQNNSKGFVQSNSIFQSNPTTRFSEIAKQAKTKNVMLSDIPGAMMLLMAINFNILGWPAGLLVSYLGVDPFQATLEQVFSLESNIFTFIINSVFNTFLIIYIGLRELYIFVFFGIIIFVRIKADLDAMSSYPLSHSDLVCSKYISLRRQCLGFADAFSQVMACMVVYTQISICTFLWMVIIGWSFIHPYLVMTFVGGTIECLGGILYALHTQSSSRISSEDLLTKHVDGFHVYGIYGGREGYQKRIWKCQRPLRIYCGKQFVIDREASMNYLNVLTDNVINVLVLVRI